jgi:hypothetical protein
MANKDTGAPGAAFALRTAAFVALALVATQTPAAEIDVGNPDIAVRWDNTFKYNAAARTKSPSATLLANPNLDDGDRNFGRGIISNRLDLLSEFDAQYKGFGVRLSGAGWYDAVYNRSNDNDSPATANASSVPYNQFTSATRSVHGRHAEFLDAFAFGKFDLGDTRLSFRLGQHSVLWGESLFFGANAIAGGQAPVDVVKLQSVPNTQFKEAIRPVPQLSAQWQVTQAASLGAYVQFGWKPNRIAAAGSYFSTTDTLQDGGEQVLFPPASAGGPFLDGNAQRLADQKARNGGQGGLQLRFHDDAADYGAYLIRFNSKSPQQVQNLGVRNVIFVPGPGCVVPGSFPTGPTSCGFVAPASYQLAYHEGITALGASVTRTFGDVNLAAEASVRHNQDLASSQAVDTSGLAPPGVVPTTNNSDNPGYAVGKTAHINLSILWSMSPTVLFQEATLVGEIAWNRLLSVTKNAAALDPNGSRDAVALRIAFEPLYRQVLPGLDLGVPMGLGYTPKGSRSLVYGSSVFPAENGGDLTLGLNGTYLDAWRFGLSYTHYYGPAKALLDAGNAFTYGQSLKDRDFASLSVRRTF